MILYHDFNVIADKPDLKHSRVSVDFGKGFILLLFLNKQQNGVKDL